MLDDVLSGVSKDVMQQRIQQAKPDMFGATPPGDIKPPVHVDPVIEQVPTVHADPIKDGRFQLGGFDITRERPRIAEEFTAIEQPIMREGFPVIEHPPTVHTSMPWKSKSEDILKEKMGGAAMGEQIAGMLRGKVPQSELEALGLDKISGKVTKQQVLDMIQSRMPQIEEVWKGTKTFTQDDIAQYMHNKPYGQLTEQEKIDVDYEIDARRAGRTGEGETKFSQYQLPGGENYRELVVKASVPHAEQEGRLRKEYDDFVERIRAKWGNIANPFDIADEGKMTQSELNEFNRINKGLESIERTPTFKSSHFDEPNILFHLRLNDRTVDGKKVLFIEEAQSDWAREIKKATKPSEQDVASFAYTENISMEKAREMLSKTDKPSHPLLKNWHELATKKALEVAVREGYDAIAWTTGEQQADRYDLSKRIAKVVASKGGMYGAKKGQVGLYVVSHEGQEVINQPVTETELEKWVGKDLADTIRKQSEAQVEYTGLDLKVGGEWAKNLYDRMIPKAMEKVTKGKASTFNLVVPKGKIRATEKIQNIIKKYDYFGFDSTGEARRSLAEYNDWESRWGDGVSPEDVKAINEWRKMLFGKTQPTLKLTPEIKEKIKKGLPLFSEAPKTVEGAPHSLLA